MKYFIAVTLIFFSIFSLGSNDLEVKKEDLSLKALKPKKSNVKKDNPNEEGLKIYNFVMHYVEDAYSKDQVPVLLLNKLKTLSLEKIRDDISSFYCLLKRDVPYFLGRLEALEKERLTLKKARSILEDEFNLQVDYSIYLVNNFIQKEIESYKV